MGAEIYRNTTVLAMKQNKDSWVVETDKGSIECEHIISCSGNFARIKKKWPEKLSKLKRFLSSLKKSA